MKHLRKFKKIFQKVATITDDDDDTSDNKRERWIILPSVISVHPWVSACCRYNSTFHDDISPSGCGLRPEKHSRQKNMCLYKTTTATTAAAASWVQARAVVRAAVVAWWLASSGSGVAHELFTVTFRNKVVLMTIYETKKHLWAPLHFWKRGQVDDDEIYPVLKVLH